MLSTLAGLLMLAPLAAVAETAEERAARCAAQADLVSEAVVLRSDGADKTRAVERIKAGDNAAAERYPSTVSVLVGWVYTLPDDQLTADAASAFEKSCVAFEQ
ncbi:hypothetical protein [Roseovarius salinarum]|uniref:hypothetical protein n=1 Tax=Roseovarius salinarum TaxID=1981892 RepID=UPI001E453A42|nr:hypothetical protein [Roseovarius salinarum]